MRANNILGIIFSNSYDEAMPEFTNLRTMGSAPFGGRYRLIDFALSNIVNSGMNKVGVITKSNYRSLMDHIGTGKPWDLDRKQGGLFLLPPFSGGSGMFDCRIEALNGIMSFISRSKEEYVVISDCNVVCNIDLTKLFEFHKKNADDITVACGRGAIPEFGDIMSFEADESARITGVDISARGEGLYSLNIFLMRKSLLQRLINEAAQMKLDFFERDIIAKNVDKLRISAYEPGGFIRTLDSLQTYYRVSLELLDKDNMSSLFDRERPVYTKIYDEMPAIYGLGSSVVDSLVSDGCTIEGTVEHSILSRGVKVSKGAVVRNSILMQNTVVGDNVSLNCTVTDKNVVINSDKVLSGAENYPLYIGKGIVI